MSSFMAGAYHMKHQKRNLHARTGDGILRAILTT